MMIPRQRRIRATLAAAVAAALAAVALVAMPTASAADSGWRQPTTDQAASRLLTTPQGNVVASNCVGDAESLEQFSVTGAKLGQVAVPNGSFCGSRVVSKNGTLVWASTDATGDIRRDTVVADLGVARKWTAQLTIPCSSAPLRVNNLVAGADGNVYGLAMPITGCSGSPYTYLFGLNINSGQVLYVNGIDTMYDGYLGAYQSGLVVMQTNQIVHFNYAGQQTQTIALGLADDEKFNIYVPTVGADGHMYIYVAGPRTSQPDCFASDQNGRILIVSPAGQVTPVSAAYCEIPTGIAAGPWGFAAIPTRVDGTNAQRIVTYNNNGTVLSTTPLSRTDGTKHYVGGPSIDHFWADSHGNAVWFDTYSDEPTVGGQVRSGATVKVINALTGAVTTWDTQSLDANKNILVENMAINEGRLYVLALVCQTTNMAGVCADPSQMVNTLFAVGLTGLGMDEPRASLIGSPPAPPTDPAGSSTPTPTTSPTGSKKLTVNAGGDSFIASRGAEPFDPDSGDCKRSQVAWPLLVTKNKAMNMEMAKFVACSGATSQDMLYGGPGQPKQVDKLKAGADITMWMAGGNNVGFTQLIYACLLVDCKTLEDPTMNKIKHLSDADQLPALYKALRKQVGKTGEIYIMGYANVMPSSGTCNTTSGLLSAFTALLKSGMLGNAADLALAKLIVKDLQLSWGDILKNFAAGTFKFSDAEVKTARRIEDALNAKIKAVVKSMKDPHLHFVDPNGKNSPWDGHGICPDKGKVSYINGLVVRDVQASFHPTPAGTVAYATIFEQYLAKHPV